MKKENMVISNAENCTVRVTRARAAEIHASGMTSTTASMKDDQKRNLRSKTKRPAPDENNNDAPAPQRKRRAVLKDVTNGFCESSLRNCFNGAKSQIKNSKEPFKRVKMKVSKVVPSVDVEIPKFKDGKDMIVVGKTGKAKVTKEEVVCLTDLQENAPFQSNIKPNAVENNTEADWKPENQKNTIPFQFQGPLKKGKCDFFGKPDLSSNIDVKDIDFDLKDTKLCSLYASEIYCNLRVAELFRRPCPNFMETIQRDITQGMRQILVDWLVEVSEEYKLVPDTLYLTVYYIDLFLSQNYIERQRLQLLGIACMLIASKYEEICAPRVEEFCFITDNTYTRRQVLQMESQVLNSFGFHLALPTTKSFLRRFIRAAQAVYKSSCLELECLVNYLAELTLLNYGFLKYLPSLIAASAVFLARWTLDQSGHPWNPTLEHYTTYSALDLKATTYALQDLQLNTNGCPLNAIRAKYRQEKFKSVATMSSPKLLDTLF